MPFPFSQLSTELALEIIRVAASPVFEDPAAAPRHYYTTALSLASVSYTMRVATMPHLLRIVVLSTSADLVSFIQSILLQRRFKRDGSRLALDYTTLVRRFWSTECWEPLVDESTDNPIDYDALYGIISKVESLGLNFRSLHLLYNGLGGVNVNPSEDWTCRRLTFAGALWRWRPLASTSEGLAFFRQITHLTLWIPNHDSDIIPDDQSPVPRWVEHVPFALMPRLTHVAFPLLRNRIRHEGQYPFYSPTEMIVYNTPPAKSCPDPTIFRQWALSRDPLNYGIVVPLRISSLTFHEKSDDVSWEVAYLQGEGDGAWDKAERMGA